METATDRRPNNSDSWHTTIQCTHGLPETSEHESMTDDPLGPSPRALVLRRRRAGVDSEQPHGIWRSASGNASRVRFQEWSRQQRVIISVSVHDSVLDIW